MMATAIENSVENVEQALTMIPEAKDEKEKTLVSNDDQIVRTEIQLDLFHTSGHIIDYQKLVQLRDKDMMLLDASEVENESENSEDNISCDGNDAKALDQDATPAILELTQNTSKSKQVQQNLKLEGNLKLIFYRRRKSCRKMIMILKMILLTMTIYFSGRMMM